MAQEYSKSFYASKKWQETRRAYLSSVYYVCERCGGPASIVHHRKYINPGNINNYMVTLDWGNLEALCLECHNTEHMGMGVCADGLGFDANGDLTPHHRKNF